MNEEDREMCREGSKLLVLTMMSSPSLQHDQKAVHATAKTDASNALERSSPLHGKVCAYVLVLQEDGMDVSMIQELLWQDQLKLIEGCCDRTMGHHGGCATSAGLPTSFVP